MMRRFTAALLALCLLGWCSLVHGQSAIIGSGVFGDVKAGGPARWKPSSTAASANVSFGATQTFNNIITGGATIPSGAEACFGFVTHQGAGAIGPLTFTVGGQTPTQIETDGSGSLYLYCATMPAVETDAIVISGVNNFGVELVAGGYFTSSVTNSAVGCTNFSSQNSNTLITIQTTCTGANTTITNPASGIGLALVWSLVGTAGTSCGTFTWSTTGSSNITNSAGDANVCLNTKPDNLSMAHTTTAGSWGPSVSSAPTFASNSAMVAATFH